jgi:hypothetical protein
LRFFFFLISFLKEKKKKLEVARFRQCVPLGRQNQAGFQKNLLVHQNSCHL